MSAARLFIAYSFQSTARVAKQLCTSDRKLILAVRRRYCVAAARDSPARPARKLENLPILRRRDKFLRRLFIGVINFAGNYLIGALLNCVVRRLSKERVQSRNCNCSGSNKVLARLVFFFLLATFPWKTNGYIDTTTLLFVRTNVTIFNYELYNDNTSENENLRIKKVLKKSKHREFL